MTSVTQGPVVHKDDNIIHWINLYPVDRVDMIYLVDQG